ncbi:hypothetical protein EDC94DRAFT_599358 [Helicostylum pulchrum]|nr:hypothetical protein EDC94DRAFT_599358 [Helicostylum pulchrum]
MVAKKHFISLFVCSLFLISHAQDNYGIIQYVKDSLMMKRSVGVHDKRYWSKLYKDEKPDKAAELGVPSVLQSGIIIKKRDSEKKEAKDDKDRLNEYISSRDDYKLKKWFEDLKKKKGTFDSKKENLLKSSKLKQQQS